MTERLSRRTALLGGASAVALAGTAGAAEEKPDLESMRAFIHNTMDMVGRIQTLVEDLHGISNKTPAGTYDALQAVANRVERDILRREVPPHSPAGSYGPVYAELFAKIGGAA